MSDDAKRERDAALAALESSPHVDEESVIAPMPTGAHPVVPPPKGSGPGAGTVLAGGGIVAALGAIDQALQAHGMTLADLTMRSGPVLGGLIANGWLVALAIIGGLWVHAKWAEDRRERITDREWARARAAAQDRHARAQVRAIRAVAEEITAIRGDLAAQAAALAAQAASQRDLAGRVEVVEREIQSLRARMPERRSPRAPD